MKATFHKRIHHLRIKVKQTAGRIHRRLGDRVTLYLLAVIIGIFCGFGAFLLKTFIHAFTRLFTPGNVFAAGSVWLLLIPLAGIILTGVICRYGFRMVVEHGVDQLNRSLKRRDYNISPKLTVAPIVASSVTLGFGGSAGAEGPIAYTGAALGSNIGKFFGLPPGVLKILIGCGAGAGIAGIFIAPIGGMLFTLEVIGMAMNTVTVIALLCSCLTAGATTFVCMGMSLDVPYYFHQPFTVAALVPTLFLGVFCGLYSLYYSFWMDRTERFLNRLNNPWVKNIIAGLTLSILIFLFPTLYGEGYSVTDCLINNSHKLLFGSTLFTPTTAWGLLAVLGGILLVKAIATQTTNSGGGVGGDFAPTLFIGSIAGYFYATLASQLLGLDIIPANFALFGMAGVMAGAIKAPLMAIFLVTEMTGDYSMFFPVTVTALTSYMIVRLFSRITGEKIYPSWQHIETR